MTPRTWLITGCSSGFGRRIAEAASARGDRVIATARDTDALDGLDAERMTLDVTDPSAIARVVTAAGAIDVLVNNAGFGTVGAVEEVEPDHLRAVMETMFFGPVALTQAVLPGMRERGGGAVVQMSSMGGQLAPAGFGAYCAAKYALEAASEALAAEVAPLGIHVVIVEPGSFRTEFGGAGLHRSPALDAYAGTVGPTRAFMDGQHGAQPGDPEKAAAAILAALDEEQPPLRLALGADAVDAIRAALEGRLETLARWEERSRATAF